MMRRLLFSVAVLVLGFCSAAHASGDVGCTPDLKAFHDGFSGCENTGLIQPSNDTRVNLTLLLLDLHKKSGMQLNGPSTNQYADWPQNDWGWPTDWQAFSAFFAAPATPDEAQQQQANGFDTEGEGTICVSDQAGADGFVKAVAAESGMDDTEKQALTEARKGLHCLVDAKQGGAPPTLPTLTLHSMPATEFAAYLAAINKFYATDHDDPAGFTALKGAAQPWVKEAAIYMEARVKLLAALQSGLSDYGDVDLKKADKTGALSAAEALKAYIAAYPQGAYINSAKGLLRRAFWLSGDMAAQIAIYNAQINETDEAVKGLDAASLSEEIDAKLPAAAYADAKADPLLVAIDLLRRMRVGDANEADYKPLTPADLEAVKDAFKDRADLYLFLQAALAHFVQHDDKAVLALLPETKLEGPLTYLQFATAMLRATASGDAAALADVIKATSLPLQNASAQMAWAMAQERAGKIDAVFDKDSPITSPLIRVRLMEYAAGPGLLRKQVVNGGLSQPERDSALYTLLYRDLTHGAYKSFVDDIKLVPPSAAKQPDPDVKLGAKPRFKDFLWDGKGEGFDCTALSAIAAKLAAAPKDAHSLLCLGEFLRLTFGDEFELSTPPIQDSLGGSGSKFPGTVMARQNIYIQVMADAKAAADDKAFALLRATLCYATVGNNHCGGKDVDKSVRKGWFNRLKKEFGGTAWARQAEYYY